MEGRFLLRKFIISLPLSRAKSILAPPPSDVFSKNQHLSPDSRACLLWHHGMVVNTTAQLNLAKPELRFCAGSNPARSMSKICNGENL